MGPLTTWPKTSLKNAPSIAAMPSLWSSAFRHSIRQIQKFRIFLVFNPDSEDVGRRNTWGEWQRKKDSCLIVSDAAETICEILKFSGALTSVEIVYMDLGRPGLKTGLESGILTPFGRLRSVRHVNVDGAPGFWPKYLKRNMQLDK